MEYASEGTLRDSIKNKSNGWYRVLYILRSIILGLQSIHESNLIHCDLHDGNILCGVGEYVEYISDFGLCKPIDYFKNKANNTNNDIYGVLPYVAPEVLRGQPYTPASDIYSFAMIMWELTSRIPPFNDRAHDLQLGLEICREGKRPEIIVGTPKCYVNLMKKCWDLDPLKRPKASEVKIIINDWWNTYNEYGDDLEQIENKQLRRDIEEILRADTILEEKRYNNSNLSEIAIESHPQAYYTSRLLDFTKELNVILEREEKGLCETISQKIIVNNEEDDCNNGLTLSDDLGNYFLYTSSLLILNAN